MSWLPSDLSNLRQWALDQEQGSGEAYESQLIDGKPALRSLESYGSLRAPRGKRCYQWQGGTDHLAIPELTGTETATCNGTATPTVSAGRIDFTAGSCWNLRINGGSWAVYHCNEEAGLVAFNSLQGGFRNGSLVNVTQGVLHGTADVPSNPANEVGHTNNAGVIVPRNEAIPAEDVQGNPLQFPGQCPYPVQVKKPCAAWQGGADYLAAPHLVGTESITEFVGTATPTVSAGRIDFTAGTAEKLILDDGTHYTFDEGNGLTFYDVGLGRNDGSAMNVVQNELWAGDTDAVRDHCLEYGGRGETFGRFDANQGQVDSNSKLDSDAEWSLKARFRIRATATQLLLHANSLNNDKPQLFTDATNLIGRYTDNSFQTIDISTPLAPLLNDWHDIELRMSAGTMSLLVDDQVMDSASFTPGPRNDFNLFVGARSNGLGPDADCAYAIVTTSGAVLFEYDFRTQGTSVVQDISGNGNDGTLSGQTAASFWFGEFIPGLLDGSAAADGNPITLLAQQHGNPGSRLIYDPWGAPRLNGYPAESPPGELLRIPGNRFFRSEENPQPSSHGTAFADGDNRVFNVDAELTGQDLIGALEYISRSVEQIESRFLAHAF